jgi:hypothetical protein
MKTAYNQFDAPYLKARKYVMASYLYYRAGESIMSDHEFDQLCRDLADEFEEIPADYIRVHNIEKTMLAEAQSGFDLRYTIMSIWAAAAWFKDITGRKIELDFSYEQGQILGQAEPAEKKLSFLDDTDDETSSFLD